MDLDRTLVWLVAMSFVNAGLMLGAGPVLTAAGVPDARVHGGGGGLVFLTGVAASASIAYGWISWLRRAERRAAVSIALFPAVMLLAVATGAAWRALTA